MNPPNIIEAIKLEIEKRAESYDDKNNVETDYYSKTCFKQGALSLLPLIEKLIEQRNAAFTPYYVHTYEDPPAEVYEAKNQELLSLLNLLK